MMFSINNTWHRRHSTFMGHEQESPWVPVIPVDRSSKISPFKGAGYRLSSLMGMHFLSSVLHNLEPRIDDDLADRLNYYYTATMILMFAILVSAKQYVGHPIECWVPAQFTKAMEQYTENYCWVQNTYWVPFEDRIPHHIDDRERRQIGYYQWVPFILALEALLFYIPTTVWRMLNQQSGLNVHGMLQLACDEQNLEPLIRARTVNTLMRHVDDALSRQRDYGARNKFVYLWAVVRLGKFYGAYVSMLYIVMKLFYLFNAVGQFVLLNRFLETTDYPLFGGHVVLDLVLGQEWKDSGKFPRVTLCDFEIRVLGNIHRHTVQCVLVINMFTEKIFIILWLWLVILVFITLLNLSFWLFTLTLTSHRRNFVVHYLDLSDSPPDPVESRRDLDRFVNVFLRPDGVFLLRMIAAHAGTVLCVDLTQALWFRFRERIKPPKIYEENAGCCSAMGNSKVDNLSDEKRVKNTTTIGSGPLKLGKETVIKYSPPSSNGCDLHGGSPLPPIEQFTRTDFL